MKKPLSSNHFPHSPNDIGADWLGRVLGDVGTTEDAPLKSVTVIKTETGFGRDDDSHVRLALSYAQPHNVAPHSLFAKFASSVPSVRTKFKELCLREIRFYQVVAPLMELHTPRCLFAGMDEKSGHFCLLLEDLTGGRAGDSLKGCSRADGELLLSEIAACHARWWREPLLSQWEWLETPDSAFAQWYEEWVRKAWPEFEHKYPDLATGWVVDAAERAIPRVRDIFAAMASRPSTLIHGDLWLDNVRFDLPEASVTVFDWQLTGRAPAANDVAWFLARSLPIATRRTNEDQLVLAYHRALESAGIRDYSLSNLRTDMNLGFLTAFLDAIGCATNDHSYSERRRQLMRAWVQRSIAVLEDHDVWESLG